MQQMMEMLQNSGMAPKQMEQMQEMFKGLEGQRGKQSSIKLKKALQKFEAKTAGHGTAQVEVNGRQYELIMTQCKITDRSTGYFSMKARQALGKEDASLVFSAGGGYSGNAMQFSSKNGRYKAQGTPTFLLAGKTLEWTGIVEGDRGEVPLKFRLTCGEEIVDYAIASKPKPKSLVNNLTLQMGKETDTFQAGRCSTKEYRTGNLTVQFEATATGTFRGRPAIVLLSKSHPVKSKRTFQNMDLFLGELTLEQRTLSPLKVAEQLNKKVEIFANKENVAIQKKYQEKIVAFQEKFDKEMAALKKKHGQNVPPAKMGELMDPFNQLMDAQGKEMDKVQEEVKAMRYPKGRSFGAITVKGQEVHFGGSKLSTQDTQLAPEFKDLPEKTELWVTCGK